MDTPQERSTSFFRFEDLRIYDKAIAYHKWLFAHLHAAVDDMQRHLTQSFCRSSYDIALNIAEGSSRNKNQFDGFLKDSKTAIRECVVYTAMATSCGMFNEEEASQSKEFLMEMTRMVSALIMSLQRPREDQTSADSASSFDEKDPYSSDIKF